MLGLEKINFTRLIVCLPLPSYAIKMHLNAMQSNCNKLQLEKRLQVLKW